MKKKNILDDKELIRQAEHYKEHTKGFTRRQFLYNAGLMSAASYISLTNIPRLMIPNAYADASASANLAYVGIECSGGLNFAGNIIVGRDNSGTQYEHGELDSYTKNGLPSDMHPSRTGMVDDSYGLNFHSSSGILRGMNQVLEGKKVSIAGIETPIKDMVDGVSFLCRTSDDTSANPISTSIPAVKAGAKGSLVNLIGTINSSAGGHFDCDPMVFDPKLSPPKVANSSDAKSLVAFGALAQKSSSDASYTNYMNKVAAFSRKRLEMMSQNKITGAAKANLQDVMQKSGEHFSEFSQTRLTPASNDGTILSTIFTPTVYGADVFKAPLSLDKELVGTIGYLLFSDLVGAANITVRGCDYHDGTAATGVRKDLEIGRYIGEIIYYAALKGKSVVIDMYTDGSAVGPGTITDTNPLGEGKMVLTSDSPVNSGSIMIVYNHGKKRTSSPIVLQSKGSSLRQVGHFLNIKGGGTNLEANGLANNVNHLWKVKMLNYLALMRPPESASDTVAAFEAIYGRNLLPGDAHDMIRFKSRG